MNKKLGANHVPGKRLSGEYVLEQKVGQQDGRSFFGGPPLFTSLSRDSTYVTYKYISTSNQKKITKAGHIFSNFRQAYWSMSTGCHHSVETTINFPLARNCLLSLLVLSCTSNNSLFLFSKHSPFLFFSFPRTTYSQFPVFWLQLFLKKTL